MAAAHHFYLNHASAGAPTLQNVAGSLIAVLDWALDVAAAGYGGTRGWEKVYESGTTYAVYRATTGIRPYLRVQDTAAEIAYVRMYQTMTDVSSGTGQCPNGSPQSVSYCTVAKGDEAGTHYFYIAGDGRAFTMVSSSDTYSSQRYFAAFTFGEFNSFDALDTYNVVLAANAQNSGDVSYSIYKKNYVHCHSVNPDISTSYGPTADNPGVFTLASPDGLITSSACFVQDPFGTYASQGKRGMASYRMGAIGIYQPFYIVDSNGQSGVYLNMFACSSQTFNEPYFRGTMPYIYSTPYAINTGLGLGTTITDGVSTFIAIDINQSLSTNNQSTRSIVFLRTSNDEPGRV